MFVVGLNNILFSTEKDDDLIVMERPSERWIDGLQFSSLFWPPPQETQQRKVISLLHLDSLDLCLVFGLSRFLLVCLLAC